MKTRRGHVTQGLGLRVSPPPPRNTTASLYKLPLQFSMQASQHVRADTWSGNVIRAGGRLVPQTQPRHQGGLPRFPGTGVFETIALSHS